MRRSTLHCALLSAVFISAIFTLSRFLGHDSARAVLVKPSTQTQGSLRVVDDKGQPVVDCPLKHTAVKAQVSGFISRVTVTQDFENPLPEKIEAIYVFPLSQAAAIDDLTMLIGERTIKGKVMRREEAETAYTAAKELGQVAALLDQERPNIFVQQVANILPGQKIRIIVSYVETLKYEDGSYEWSFPMVVGQRYVPDRRSSDQDNARISPPVVPKGMRAGHDISIELDLNSGVPILGVDSETHETEVQLLDQTCARVQLKDLVTIPNKDFVLKYRVAGQSINDAVLTHRTERGGFFTLILQPPQRVSPAYGTSATISVMACDSVTSVSKATSTFATMPVQSRSFERFSYIAAGTVPVKTGGLVQPSAPTTLINGQPSNFVIDGVPANFAIAPGGESPGPTASGNVPAFTASGGGNGIGSLDAIQEMTINNFSVKAENGRTAGGQVLVTTQAGTNNFHGSAFHFFGNDSFDASDWFANSRGLPQPPKKLNIFGGTLGGPIVRDKSFFFGAYEGMRLRQPVVGITDVPSLSARSTAALPMRAFLEAFPVPNGSARPDGFAEFASSFANPAGHDVGSIRIDQNVTSTLHLEARYSFANSDAERHGADRLSLNTINRIRSSAQAVTGSMSYVVTPSMIIELRGAYSRQRVDGSYFLDQFGGAAIPPAFAPGSFAFDLNSRSAGWLVGDETRSVQRQVYLSGMLAKMITNHSLKFGGDYRRLSPTIGVRTAQQNVLFDGVDQAVTGVVGRFSNLQHIGPQRPVIESYSLFAQDDWRITPDLTLSYGMRWEVAPAPSSEGAFAVDQVGNPATLNLEPVGSSLWQTTFGNFGPRAGVAYQLSDRSGAEVVLRGGFGLMYDVGHGRVGDVFTNSLPFIAPFPAGIANSADLPLVAFDPHLKLPYTVNWNVSIETALKSRNRITIDYVGTRGKRLLHTETLFDQNPDFGFLRLTTNRGRSDYRALQASYHGYLSDGFQSSVSYTWSRSFDNITSDSEPNVVMTSFNPDRDRGPSDFHARHALTGALSYMLPAVTSGGLANKLSRNWTISSILSARSARPLNVVYMFPTSIGIAYLRPDVVSGVSLFIADPAAPGGRRINPDAFRAPTGLEQGSLSRNSLRGFTLYQVDLGLNRKFNFTEGLALQVEAAAFNLFNRANLEDPLGNDLVIGSRFGASDALTLNLAFGESTSMSGRNLGSGGFASFYGTGGARTMRFSVKLLF